MGTTPFDLSSLQQPDVAAGPAPGGDQSQALISLLQQSGGKLASDQSPLPPDPSQDPSAQLRAYLQQTAQQSPNDILLQKLHMTQAEKDKRGKWGNVAQVGGNILQALVTGRNFKTEADKDYAAQTQRLQQGNDVVRNEDLAKKAKADEELRASLGAQLAASKAAHEKTLADVEASKSEDRKNTVAAAYDKNAIAAAYNQARSGNAADKLALENRIQDYHEKHPNERPESFIANALTEASPDGKLNIVEYQKALDNFYKSQSLRQGPIVKTTEVPVFDPNTGRQTDTKIVPTLINRQNGTTSTPGQTAAPVQGTTPPVAGQVAPPAATPGAVKYGETIGGVAVPKANAKDISAVADARKPAYESAQTLLQDFGSGKIDSYTGALNGSKPMQWLRNQGYLGGVSSGEALRGLLSPENTIRNIRSMSPRINQTEINKFDGVHGTQTQDGETLVRRGLIYALNKDYDLKDKMGAIPKISDGKGGAVPINETPEFGVALREVVDKTIKDSKTSKGMVVKAPNFDDVVALTKAKIQAGAADKVKTLQDQLKQIAPASAVPAALADRLTKYQE